MSETELLRLREDLNVLHEFAVKLKKRVASVDAPAPKHKPAPRLVRSDSIDSNVVQLRAR